MTRFILPIFSLLLSLQIAQGQDRPRQDESKIHSPSLSIASTAMRSVRGWKYGLEIGFTLKNELHIAGFSYSSNSVLEGKTKKDTYQGVQLGFPLFQMERWSIQSTQKLGFYNKRFFSLLPTVDVKYDANKRVSAVIGGGVSDRFPLFNFKLIFHLKDRF